MKYFYISFTYICLFLFTYSMETYAYNLSDIVNKKWYYVSDMPNDIIKMNIECNNSTAKISVHIQGSDEDFIWTFAYHLSNEDNPAFKEASVGKITEGQYILMRGTNLPEGAINDFIFHIESLSTDSLTIKLLNDNTIISSDAPKVWKFIHTSSQ